MATLPWLRNFVGLPLSTNELADIKHPLAEVQFHTSLKFAEAGVVIGVGIGQLMGLIRAKKFHSKMKQTAAFMSGRKGRNWMFGCTLLSFPASFGYYKSMKYDDDDFYDRAFRLRMNKYQLRIDRFTLLCGFGVGILLFQKGMFWYGLPLGMTVGLTSMAMYNAMLYKMELKSDANLKPLNFDDLPLSASERIKKSQEKTRQAHGEFENILTSILETSAAFRQLRASLSKQKNGETNENNDNNNNNADTIKEPLVTKLVRSQRDQLAKKRMQNELHNNEQIPENSDSLTNNDQSLNRQ